MKPKENYNGFKKKFKFIANIISWTILVVLLLIAAFLAYYFIATKMYASKGKKFEPAVGLYTIVSPSMTPNLNVYDVIVDTKVKKPEDIKVGDIITFVSRSTISKGLTITHRVVAIVETEEGLEYKTQGDNNLSPDSTTVPFKNVLGKVLIKIPQLGRIQSFLSSSSGWLLIVVIPALIIIISDVVKIFRLSKAKKKVGEALTTEEANITKEEEKKEEIKEKLKKRYNSERSQYEPDPLRTDIELTKVEAYEQIKEKNEEAPVVEKTPQDEIIFEEKIEKDQEMEKAQEEVANDIPLVEKKSFTFDLPKLKEETKSDPKKKKKRR